MRYYVEINRAVDHYEGLVHKGHRDVGIRLPSLALHPEAKVTIKGIPLSLESVVTSLIGFRPRDLNNIDERWQLELGQYLYDQILGNISALREPHNHGEKIEIRIATQDEYISRLPWVLLSNNGIFLSASGWSISYCETVASLDCELPPSPRVLICIPQPDDMDDTGAIAHVEALEEILSSSDRLLSRNRNLAIVASKEDFMKAVAEFRPHILYYYGHGLGDLNTSRLVFTTGKRGTRVEVPIADVANTLRQIQGGPPLLVYLNCCLGDAGGLLGAGRQLRTFVPAVITNYTLAQIDAAQAQGVAVLRSTLLDGVAPHVAIAEMRTNLGRMNLSFRDLRWMTPVLHSQYDHWKANPPQRLNRFERDAHWRFKLDRVRQFGQVAYQTTQMLRARKPKSLAYLWYGKEGQGIDLFHQRLKIELQEHIGNTHLYEVRAEWPVEFSSPHRSWEDMLTEAFDVQSIDHIVGRIRTQTRGVSGQLTLVYVRHQPVRSSKVINPQILRRYLEWWDCNFIPLLDNQTFALLGVSFVVGKPRNFLATTESEGIGDLQLDGCVVQILDEMERLSKKDLMDFLQTHSIRLPIKYRDRLLDRILEITQGSYEITLEALEDLTDRAWDFEAEERKTPNSMADYNYD